jgi:glycosyltransferase involved in cell wall biosynthesis
MLVSIVTPCLDPGERLARCLASVASQTYANVEHVVVDGGSTDGTVELLAQSGVSYVSERDSGQTDAIRKGIALARGDLLTWLNADDELTRDAVARAVHAGGEWTYGDCAVILGKKRTVWRPLPRYGNWEIDAGEMIPQPGSFFSRAALDRAGGLDPSFELTMDIDLWLRLVDSGVTPRYVRGVVAAFEIHGDSKTGSLGRSAFLLEHARALAKSGRIEAASAAVGRSLAFDPSLDGIPAWAEPRIVRRAAAAERAVERLRRGDLRGLGALARPAVWRERVVRRRLLASLRRGLRIG